jgi:hypothetical protein
MFGNSELKVITGLMVTAFSSVTTTPVADRISIAGGSDWDERVGRQVSTIGFRLSGCLVGGQIGAITDDTNDTVRLSLLLCTVGNQPTVANYSVSSILNDRAIVGLKRVLYDRTFSLNTPGVDATGYLPALTDVSIQIPCRVHLAYYGSAVNTESDVALYLMCVSNSAAVTNPGFINGSYVLTYLDR